MRPAAPPVLRPSPTALVCALTALLASCRGGAEADPEGVVGAAVRAARAEDALAFQQYVETAVIPPADGVVLVDALAGAVRVGGARRVEDAARVEIGVRPAGLDTSFELGLRLRRGDTHWRIVQVENAASFRSALTRAKADRVERENARLEGRMRRALQLGEVVRTVRYRDVSAPEQVYRYAHVSLRVPVLNARADDLVGGTVEVLVTDSAGTDYRYLLPILGTIRHERTGAAALDTTPGVLTGYPIDYGNATEAEAVGTWRLASARPVAAVFRSGERLDTVRLYADWEDYMRRGGVRR